MRDDAAYLLDMLIAARKIQQFVADVNETMFDNSELHQSAVVRELLVIGEAARFISAEYKTQHPEIPWNIIAGMRNRLVHEYFRIRLNIVWQTVQQDIPTLIEQLERLISSSNPQDSP
jgi:uncharacterized protein with HEPN domain